MTIYKRILGMISVALLMVAGGALPCWANAGDAYEKGRAIALAVENRDLGFLDSTAQLKMVLINQDGEQTVRKLELQRLENQSGGDKSLIRFEFPADIRDTMLLTHPKVESSDDQWLYLPSINRTKRISSRNKSGSFVGSEFSFEDMSDKSVDEYQYRYLEAVPCRQVNVQSDANTTCDLLERIPNDKLSGYTKQHVWIEQENKTTQRVDYYDRKDQLLKTMKASQFELFNQRYWRPKHVEMHNVQSGRITQLIYQNIKFKQGISESELSRRKLGS